MPKLTVIIPTISRPSLCQTLESVVFQLLPGDQVLVAGDGVQFDAQQMCHDIHMLKWDLTNCPICDGTVELTYIELPKAQDWGNSQRNTCMDKYAKGDYIAFLDDDDIWSADARRVIETALSDPDHSKPLPRIFRMITERGEILWGPPDLREANVGTPMFVVPNDANRLGKFSRRYEGDFDFITETVRRFDGAVLWEPGIVCVCRPGAKK